MLEDLIQKKEYEGKRNHYEDLYQKLDRLIERHQETYQHIKQTNQQFISMMPVIDQQAYPGLDFDFRQKGLHEELEQYISKEGAHLIHLSSARTESYNRYLHYQELLNQ
ncbi:hypothetical protein [Isobaculum melis]|uniref:Uncharacterized protein n=1 Tax=Isobaculum melis TaxID=142588 RepID=A0A1H9PWT9_9LACT|nr:hypothetical protein [Isobaculum melis]SER52642.1 hypothetical protein SAMN04488559_101197 [Isobaculum melis]